MVFCLSVSVSVIFTSVTLFSVPVTFRDLRPDTLQASRVAHRACPSARQRRSALLEYRLSLLDWSLLARNTGHAFFWHWRMTLAVFAVALPF